MFGFLEEDGRTVPLGKGEEGIEGGGGVESVWLIRIEIFNQTVKKNKPERETEKLLLKEKGSERHD